MCTQVNTACHSGGRGRAAKRGRRELKELRATPGLSGTISGGGGPGRSRGCPGLDPDGVETFLAGSPISWAGPQVTWAGAVRAWPCWAVQSGWVAALRGVTRVVLVEAARRGAPAAGLLRDCCCSGEGRGDAEVERREEWWGCRWATPPGGGSETWAGLFGFLWQGLPERTGGGRKPYGVEHPLWGTAKLPLNGVRPASCRA
ncbi:hypothetical protein NDU88_004692 [Pleurodeles waltl]|uniref:Uncharacterized protein n=1 Tax=Pleurodeles waltl TaxID=8319 RepID=A0AAV7W5P6_PLEWA|nr:hypothetical protein NDU88_004692 [Pleurodeles waltl]